MSDGGERQPAEGMGAPAVDAWVRRALNEEPAPQGTLRRALEQWESERAEGRRVRVAPRLVLIMRHARPAVVAATVLLLAVTVYRYRERSPAPVSDTLPPGSTAARTMRKAARELAHAEERTRQKPLARLRSAYVLPKQAPPIEAFPRAGSTYPPGSSMRAERVPSAPRTKAAGGRSPVHGGGATPPAGGQPLSDRPALAQTTAPLPASAPVEARTSSAQAPSAEASRALAGMAGASYPHAKVARTRSFATDLAYLNGESGEAPVDYGDPRLAAPVTLEVAAAAMADIAGILRTSTQVELSLPSDTATRSLAIYCRERPLAEVLRHVARFFNLRWQAEGPQGAPRYAARPAEGPATDRASSHRPGSGLHEPPGETVQHDAEQKTPMLGDPESVAEFRAGRPATVLKDNDWLLVFAGDPARK